MRKDSMRFRDNEEGIIQGHNGQALPPLHLDGGNAVLGGVVLRIQVNRLHG